MTTNEQTTPSPTTQMVFDDGTCAICLELHENKSQTPCRHVFCFQCLTNWCQIKLECPVCKQSFTSFKHSFQSPDDYQVHTPTPPVVPVLTTYRYNLNAREVLIVYNATEEFVRNFETDEEYRTRILASFMWNNTSVIVLLSDYFQYTIMKEIFLSYSCYL